MDCTGNLTAEVHWQTLDNTRLQVNPSKFSRKDSRTIAFNERNNNISPKMLLRKINNAY